MEVSSEVRHQIMEACRDWLCAIKENDSEAFFEMLHPQYYYVTYQGKILRREEFIHAFQQIPECSLHLDPELRSLELSDSVATVVTVLRGDFLVEGQVQQGVHTTSHTLVRETGRWVFIAGHFARES